MIAAEVRHSISAEFEDSDDDYYDGDFDEPPTPDFGMDDWYPNDEW